MSTVKTKSKEESKVKEEVKPVKLLDERKREANRKHKVKHDAIKAGMDTAEYVKKFFNVTIEEYITDEFYNTVLKNSNTLSLSKQGPPIEELMQNIQLEQVDMHTVKIDKSGLKPIKTNTPIDKLLSKKLGALPGTVNIITGESGAGKTTICNNICIYAKRANKKLTVGCLHAEMSLLDWESECETNNNLRDVGVIFVRNFNKYTGNEYLAAVKKALMQWKLCVVDSLAVLSDRIKDQTGMSEKEAMFWLIDTMNELAENDLNCYFVIQHFTKGLQYVGPSRLKHDTTSMAYVLFDKAKEPFIIFNKNRRGSGLLHMPLYTKIDPKDGMLLFDGERLQSLIEDQKIMKIREAETRKGKTDLDEILNLEKQFIDDVNNKAAAIDEDEEI